MSARAIETYREISAAGRIEGAQPGQLIMTLFEELIDCIDNMYGAILSGRPLRRDVARNRADVILMSMETGTNADAGVLSKRMVSIYSGIRALLQRAVVESNVEHIVEARSRLQPIVEAWRAIV
ncbi:flagellar export chaperone FliS [Sphingomonas paeninsulae]|uniref:flagellar export chaperone FliS n=1 Tax=Sphingomonas paeninsulae TaxID=2319844 RepID=UPI0013CF3BA2|nr:flagellar protein FliS [Sphingomonas paeninsulae]